MNGVTLQRLSGNLPARTLYSYGTILFLNTLTANLQKCFLEFQQIHPSLLCHTPPEDMLPVITQLHAYISPVTEPPLIMYP